MPVYTYQIINADGSEGDVVELVRKMSDPPLKRHPETGQELKRIFTAPHIAGVSNSIHDKKRLTDKNLEKQGFTTYRRNGRGHYERTTGTQGPATLSAGD